MKKRRLNLVLSALLALCATMAFAGGKKLKVYLLAGQSNMQGHAHVKTLPHMAADPVSKALHDRIVDADGKPRVYAPVRVAAFSEMDAWGNPKPEQTAKTGPLSVGFGSHLKDSNKFGPELGFGITMAEQSEQPILIIKTAWGGRSLFKDYRPPSAGPYDSALSDEQKAAAKERREAWRQKHGEKEAAKWKLSIDEILELRGTAEGRYYRWLVEHVKRVLTDPGTHHPAYDEAAGYELAGFVWFQGFNDLVSGNRYEPWGGHAAYGKWLACLIRDLRKDLSAPDMPVVIGVMGVGGKIEDVPEKNRERMKTFRDAMAAPAAMPEFKGRVVAVQTADFWPEDVDEVAGRREKLKQQAKREVREKAKANPELKERELNVWQRERLEELIMEKLSDEERHLLETGSCNWSLHYYGNAKCFGRMGEAFAQGLSKVENEK